MDRFIRGEKGQHEILTSFRVGADSPSTTSTSYEQPYANAYRSPLPRNILEQGSWGFDGLALSLSGRLHTGDSSTEVSIIGMDASNQVPETEHTSTTGASYEEFHTGIGEISAVDDILFTDYHLKSSTGQSARAEGYVYAHFWGVLE